MRTKNEISNFTDLGSRIVAGGEQHTIIRSPGKLAERDHIVVSRDAINAFTLP